MLEERGAIYLSSLHRPVLRLRRDFRRRPARHHRPRLRTPTRNVTEENYFFKLSEYQEQLINLIESGELHIQPETTKNEVLSFLRGGQASRSCKLRSSSICCIRPRQPYVPGAQRPLHLAHHFDWGIPVPGNPKHVIYVWLDALANYMTAVGYGSRRPADIAKFERYWPADLHLVGKEITRFHCVYWPAFLMAAGLRAAESVVANGWLLFEESKMSKSRGNVVRTETILDAFGPFPPVPARRHRRSDGPAIAPSFSPT